MTSHSHLKWEESWQGTENNKGTVLFVQTTAVGEAIRQGPGEISLEAVKKSGTWGLQIIEEGIGWHTHCGWRRGGGAFGVLLGLFARQYTCSEEFQMLPPPPPATMCVSPATLH